jgi:16S rRNA (adenine1518-N6/adenine1519-N6)-dimethyltransferase
MKLSEMREILAMGDIQLTKSLGQNFLHDQNQLRRIVAAAELTNGDKVLEIGPGLGPLTGLLIAEAGEVLAIEKDRRLFDVLQGRFASAANLKLLHADALDYVRDNRDWNGWKLVANLPYSVASPILVELAEAENPPERLVVTLQLEVARRIMARPGDDDYGVLTLLLQREYGPESSFKIPASCFFPEPDVGSACVMLQRRSQRLLPADQTSVFTRIVKRAFSQRRKMMLKLLKQDWPSEKLAGVFDSLGIPTQIRAEQIALEKFVALTRWLTDSDNRKQD